MQHFSISKLFLTFTAMAVVGFMTLTPAAAQTVDPMHVAVEKESLKKRLLEKEKDSGKEYLVSVAVENDLFGSGLDKNYTNGVRLTYMDINARIPWPVRESLDWFPFFSINDTAAVYYSVGQNLYTPSDITIANPGQNERPYAAWLYASAGLTVLKDEYIDQAEVSIGMVGPAALGEETQKFVHKHISPDSKNPQGWSHQLKNEPGLILSWERMWPTYHEIDAPYFDIRTTPYAGATLGNIYTYANTGVTFAFMPKSQNLQASPTRVRPSIPGSGYFDIPKDKWGWYLFAGAEGRAIPRNIFLDGNTFTDSRDVDKKPFVGDLSAGFAVTYDDLRFTYTLNYRTLEYDGQDDQSLFGSVSLTKRF